MATSVSIPKLGISMTEATLVEWLVEDGATVSTGQVLYLLETDKVETEVESPTAGVVRVLAAPGETYPVGTPVAEIS